MTAPRRPRSAWLLVGSTPGTPAKLHRAGQRLSRLPAKVRWRRLRAALARRLLEQRPELLLERADALEQAVTVSVPAELSPGPEQPPRDLKAGRAELLLGAEPLAVGGEVAHQVGPAELAPLRVEIVVGPPAVRAGDAGEVLAEQRLGLAAVATLGDAEDRGAAGERAPERALAAAQAPAGLVDVERRRGAHVAEQVLVGLLQGGARAADDGLDGTARERGAEELAQELCGVAPRDAVPDRQGDDRRLEARAEGAGWDLGRQLCPRGAAARRAAQAL